MICSVMLCYMEEAGHKKLPTVWYYLYEILEQAKLTRADKIVMNVFKDLKENMNIMRREMEDIKHSYMELLEMKNTISERKMSLDDINRLGWHSG